MSWILVTNDDGVDSPALAPLVRALAPLGDIEALVPDGERSWIGKAVSRHDEITTATTEVDGIPVTTCSGYPADCVQIGVHHLRRTPPRLVVSGINIGYNHGAGFVLGSGTVGAAVEAWASGVPSVALSAGTMGDFHDWRADILGPHSRPTWTRLAKLSAEVVADADRSSALGACDLLNVNLPSTADASTERWITDVARIGYDRLFDKIDEGADPASEGLDDRTTGTFRFTRSLRIRRLGETRVSDVDAARAGAISITPLVIPGGADDTGAFADLARG